MNTATAEKPIDLVRLRALAIRLYRAGELAVRASAGIPARHAKRVDLQERQKNEERKVKRDLRELRDELVSMALD